MKKTYCIQLGVYLELEEDTKEEQMVKHLAACKPLDYDNNEYVCKCKKFAISREDLFKFIHKVIGPSSSFLRVD